MLLGELLETVETLRARIEAHQQVLSENEVRTRYALIDPLLRSLGWDVSDPGQVVPKYDIERKRADYALLAASGKPAVMVEAKRLGRALEDGLDQSISYCVSKATPYFCVTDGQRWALYETFRRVETPDKLVNRFDLVKDKLSEVCLKAIALWNPAVAEGVVREGEASVVKEPTLPTEAVTPAAALWQCPKRDKALDQSETRLIAGHKAVHTREEKREGGTPLTVLAAGGKLPAGSQIRVPDGQTIQIKGWVQIPEQVAIWLNRKGHLTERQCPITSGKRYLVATQPMHPGGTEFRRSKRVGSLWLESNYSARDSVRNAQRIIEHAGLDPVDFLVQLAK